MRLVELVEASAAVAGTRSRLAKSAAIADVLRHAAPAEIALVARYLTGSLRQRRTGIGWASIRSAPPPAAEPTLTVAEVDDAFERASLDSGPGSSQRRRQIVEDLYGRATGAEQRHLSGLISGELRQGALESAVADGLARAFEVDPVRVRRAVMLGGELPAVAGALARDGADGLAAFRLQVGRPIQPMLAASAPDVASALAKISAGAGAGAGAAPDGVPRLEHKLDGVRVQVHRDGEHVLVVSRTLDDLTPRLPEVVAAVLALPVHQVVLDGEVIALAAGRPVPFQVTASRVATHESGSEPLSVFFFDLLHLDGHDLLDEPAALRWSELDRVVPAAARVGSLRTADPARGQEFFDAAIESGQEGLVVKAAGAPYAAGRRGAGWVKVKPRHTLDLVVLAAERGHGRRTGLLSNLHLGALGDDGEYVMVGKTFKGLTDELLRWQTETFPPYASPSSDRDDDGWTTRLDPHFVVEIAFDGVQTSRRYPGGAALRFARVLRYRPDKTPEQADTFAEIRRIRDLTGDEHLDDGTADVDGASTDST